MKIFFFKKLTLFFAFFLISCSDFKEVPENILTLTGLDKHNVSKTIDFTKCDKSFILLGNTFCAYCHEETEYLKQEYLTRKDSDFCALYVSSDKTIAGMKAFIEKKEIPFDALHWNYSIMNALGNPYAVPAYCLLGKGGKVLKCSIGKLDADSLKKLIDAY